ncbi:MAG: hypothetical protein GF393_07425 [Armatimonadia bacterium]|nr:hypothetical protein [Armatimonadia bacterium]
MSERETTFARHAREVLAAGEPRGALQIVGSWLPLSPDDAGSWGVAFQAHLELDELDDAERAAREVVRLRPESADAWYDFATVLDRLGKQSERRKALHRALSLEPEHERARAEVDGGDDAPRKEAAPTPREPEEPTVDVPPDMPPPPPPAPEAPRPQRRDDPEDTHAFARPERPKASWLGESLDEPKPAGWKVRTPEGTLHGPYTTEELEHHVVQSNISLDWHARFENGRILTVREAVGPERCTELLLQRAEEMTATRAAQEPVQVVETTPPPANSELTYCPNCGQWTVTAEKKSAHGQRIALFLLGFLFLPLWILILFVKDRMQFRCGSCGEQWTSRI